MSNGIAQWFADNLQQYLPAEIIIVLLSMSPIMELKGGMIVASILNMNMTKAIIICMIANIIPVPFIFFFIDKIFEKLKKTRLKSFILKTENKIMSKKDFINKYGFWGLLIITGIVIPGTGAWTASLAASLLHISLKKAILPIFLGLILCIVIMVTITYIIPNLIIG